MTNSAIHPPTFGQWLKRLRIQHDLTQEALAELASCSVQAIRAFEAGKRRPSVEMAERLADVLAVPAEQQAVFVRLARAALVTTKDNGTAAPSPPVTRPTTAALGPAAFPLPSVPTPFIGRAGELSTLRHLLLEESHPGGSHRGARFVTIVGPGGMGKTRLALDLTTALAEHFPDGVGFVSLVAVNQVQHLPSAIAASLNIGLQGAADLQQQVNAWLAPRHMLLTLDNFEQLLAQDGIVAWVRQLLAEAPQIQLLITSRERLRVSGERVYELGGLPLPVSDHPGGQADAALLFLERAQQIVADFVINPHNQAAVSRICHLVEGMPLGIELAAAWVNILTPAEIADEISRSIDFLARSDRDMAPRHRSMRAVFDHSWRLLSEEERTVLMKLSVFRGGCTREAAQQVAGATLPILASLIDKSLLRKSQRTPTRYTMHELVRQYAVDRLQASAVAASTVADAYADYYYHLARAAEEQIWGAQIADAVSRLEAENDNLRVVLNHYLTDPGGVERSINMAGLLWRFWDMRGYITEGRTWLERALQRGIEPPAPWRWLALHGAGNLANTQGDYTVARQHYEECLHLLQTELQTLADPDAIQRLRHRIAMTLTNLGNNALSQGKLGQAFTFSEEALTLLRQSNHQIGVAITTTNLAKIKLLQHQLDEAERLSIESLALYRDLGDERGIGWNLTTLGTIAREQGDYAQAAHLYQEARLLFEKLGDQADMATLHCDLGDLASAQGEDARAEAHYQAGLMLAKALGSKKDMAMLLDRLSSMACQRGDHAQATTWSEQSIALYRTIGDLLGLGQSLHTRGKIAEALAAHEAAAHYYAESRQCQAQVDHQTDIPNPIV